MGVHVHTGTELITKISGKFTATAPLGGGMEPRSTVGCIVSLGKLFSHPAILSARSTRTSWTISERQGCSRSCPSTLPTLPTFRLLLLKKRLFEIHGVNSSLIHIDESARTISDIRGQARHRFGLSLDTADGQHASRDLMARAESGSLLIVMSSFSRTMPTEEDLRWRESSGE